MKTFEVERSMDVCEKDKERKRKLQTDKRVKNRRV